MWTSSFYQGVLSDTGWLQWYLHPHPRPRQDPATNSLCAGRSEGQIAVW